MNGYACQLTYKSLKNLSNNEIIMADLPVNSSNMLQPFNGGVLGPLKEEFKRQIDRHTIKTEKDARNDTFNIYELLSYAYHKSITAVNEISGFRMRGSWASEKTGCDSSHIWGGEFTFSKLESSAFGSLPSTHSVRRLIGKSKESANHVKTFKDLYGLFLKHGEKLWSDKARIENGTIMFSTRTGATWYQKIFLMLCSRRAKCGTHCKSHA